MPSVDSNEVQLEEDCSRQLKFDVQMFEASVQLTDGAAGTSNSTALSSSPDAPDE